MSSIVQKLTLMWGQLDDEWRGVVEDAIAEIERLKCKEPLSYDERTY